MNSIETMEAMPGLDFVSLEHFTEGGVVLLATCYNVLEDYLISCGSILLIRRLEEYITLYSFAPKAGTLYQLDRNEKLQ